MDWKKKKRLHCDELPGLKELIDHQRGTDNDVLQKVMMHPKGVMLWSNKILSVFYKRCENDIVYLDATGSVIKKSTAESPPYYVYELVVRNPSKGASPLPVATYVTCDHTTASVTYFLQAFQTDVIRMYGNQKDRHDNMWWLPCAYALHFHYILQNRSGGSVAEVLPLDYRTASNRNIWPPHSS